MQNLKAPRFFVVSGIPDDSSGTGRVMQLLKREFAQAASVSFCFRPRESRHFLRAIKHRDWKSAYWELGELARTWKVFLQKARAAAFSASGPVIFFHPQNFGMFKAFLFFLFRKAQTYLFLLDSSFFCVRSYNHLDSESQPCLRCVGGSWQNRSQNGCQPFPTTNWFSGWFLKYLKRSVAEKKNSVTRPESTSG